MSFKLITIQLIFFFYLINEALQFQKIPFKIEFDDRSSTRSEEEKILKSIANSATVGEIEVGTPTQKIKMELHSKNFYMYFLTSDLNNGRINGYDKTKSETYESKYKSELRIYDTKDYLNGEEFYEELPLCKNRSLLYPLATELESSSASLRKNGGRIGLDISEGKYEYSNIFNLIGKMKTVGAIENYDFYFDYITRFEGNLILGAKYYDIHDSADPNNFTNVKATIVKDNYQHWSFPLDGFSINGELAEESKDAKVLFSFEEYMITAPKEYLNLFKSKFFDGNRCSDYTFDGYIYYVCKDNSNFKKLDRVQIDATGEDLKRTSFIFSYKDLFYEQNNKHYFLIRFATNSNVDYFTLGQVFLGKYNIAFNQDSKHMVLPVIYGPEVYEKAKKNKSSVVYIILLILLCIILGGVVGGFLYFIKTHKKRRVRASELEDNYEYSTSIGSNNEMNKKLVIDS